MARGLSSDVKTELATGVIDPVLLVLINFGTPQYLTNAGFDITSSVSGSSQTYTASGHLKAISPVSETNKPTKNSLQISLSGVDQSMISVALSENIINDQVKIWRGFLDDNNDLLDNVYFGYKIVGSLNWIDDNKRISVFNSVARTLDIRRHVNNLFIEITLGPRSDSHGVIRVIEKL